MSNLEQLHGNDLPQHQDQDQDQDLTPLMQEILAQMARMQAELNDIRTRSQALSKLPEVANPSPVETPATANTSTRRKVLRRLAGGMLTGLVAGGLALTLDSSDSQAKTVVNPAGTNNRVGTFIVPPGQAVPVGIPGSSAVFGLVSTDGSSLNMANIPTYANLPTGVLGYSGFAGGNGVTGYASGPGAFGVYGFSDTSSSGYGMYGQTTGTNSYGVYGQASGAGGYGMAGVAAGAGGYGVYGVAVGASRYGGYFVGDVYFTGTLTGGTKSFKIDHPLDPANKYLYHTSVESPDMKNMYDGVVSLDERGQAVVELPGWFETLNSNFRYQLTCVGQYAPVFIAEEIKGLSFKIAGGVAGQQVCWQVTGIRQDAFARAYRTPVEEEKTGAEKGLYLHPELFGQPEEMAIGRRPVSDKQTR